ncbi:MAG: glutathione S-transferase family protein [Gammaproteobacteria bacterium]
MPSYRLTYFDFDGGRAEPIRIAFHVADIEFEDIRWSFPEFGAKRRSTRFNSVPVLEIDGAAVSQSNALSRYVGKMAGLYPKDDLQALYCDEVLDALEDVSHYIVRTFGLEGEVLRKAREQLADGWLTVYVRGLDELLARGGGEYFADNTLTIADLKAFVQTRALQAGNLDHIPTDLVQRLAPSLIEHQQRVESDPLVVAYYATRQ